MGKQLVSSASEAPWVAFVVPTCYGDAETISDIASEIDYLMSAMQNVSSEAGDYFFKALLSGFSFQQVIDAMCDGAYLYRECSDMTQDTCEEIVALCRKIISERVKS
jgi:hypothetical protein